MVGLDGVTALDRLELSDGWLPASKRYPAVIIPHQHRRPPKPPWMYQSPRMGICTWCGESILAGQRSRPGQCSWHFECLAEYRALFDWNSVRSLVWQRDREACQCCGTVLWEKKTIGVPSYNPASGVVDIPHTFITRHPYEVDHIRPLHQWEARVYDDLTQDNLLDWYEPWLPSNLQLLCPDCHKRKTVEERAR